jgi:hypothetical protein
MPTMPLLPLVGRQPPPTHTPPPELDNVVLGWWISAFSMTLRAKAS